MTEDDWRRALGVQTGGEMLIAGVVLDAASDMFGVSKEKLRPEDKLYTDVGVFGTMTLDDMQDALIESIDEMLTEHFRVDRISNVDLSRATIKEIYNDVLRSELACAVCGYALKPRTLPRCPECGIEINWPVP